MLLAHNTVCVYVAVNVTYVFKEIEYLIYVLNFSSLLTVYWEERFLLGHVEGFAFTVCSARHFVLC